MADVVPDQIPNTVVRTLKMLDGNAQVASIIDHWNWRNERQREPTQIWKGKGE